VDLIDAYSTDAKLLRYGLRVLADDRSFFPPYDAAPLARGDTLRAHPEVAEALGKLAYRLSDRRMTELNHAVEEEGRSFTEVAHAFLLEEGLLSPGDVEVDASGPRRGGFVSMMVERRAETLRLAGEHLRLTALSVLFAALLAIPLGVLATRSRLLERASLNAFGVVQTIPSLALLAFMIAVPGLGLSMRSAVVALFLYAVLPILRNTFAGLRNVDADLVDAARGMGLTERQTLLRVQLPLATSTIMAGVRTSTVISIGVATLAAFIGAGGLGEPIVTGLYLNDTGLILSGAVPAAVLALAADFLLVRAYQWPFSRRAA
jgi:osmoprotectant transport system permease protein